LAFLARSSTFGLDIDHGRRSRGGRARFLSFTVLHKSGRSVDGGAVSATSLVCLGLPVAESCFGVGSGTCELNGKSSIRAAVDENATPFRRPDLGEILCCGISCYADERMFVASAKNAAGIRAESLLLHFLELATHQGFVGVGWLEFRVQEQENAWTSSTTNTYIQPNVRCRNARRERDFRRH
jgi:hypothetical protein